MGVGRARFPCLRGADALGCAHLFSGKRGNDVKAKTHIKIAIAVLISAVFAFPAFAQSKTSYAGVGFMALSPNLSDTLSSYSVNDTLYGGTVSFAVNPWFTVGAGYILREDTPARLFEHVSETAFYLGDGYAFVTAKLVLR